MNHRKQRLVPSIQKQDEHHYVGVKRLYREMDGSPQSLKQPGKSSPAFAGTRSPKRHMKMSFESGLASLAPLPTNTATRAISPDLKEQEQKIQQVNEESPQLLEESTHNQETVGGQRTSHTSQSCQQSSDSQPSVLEKNGVSAFNTIGVANVDIGEQIDFGYYTKYMIDDKPKQPDNIFKSTKLNQLEISSLQVHCDQSVHIDRNKLSRKLDRRDIQFYDLYKLGQPQENVVRLKDSSFKLEGVLPSKNENEPLYGDIECEDFNQIWKNSEIISQKFGKSITVKLRKQGNTLERRVMEDRAKIISMASEGNRPGLLFDSEKPKASLEEKIEINTIKAQLRNLMREFKKSEQEIAEIYASVNGKPKKVRKVLDGRKVIRWNKLEDLALAMPEDSPQFAYLQQQKGPKQIAQRRNFLAAAPITETEIIQICGSQKVVVQDKAAVTAQTEKSEDKNE